MKEKLSLLGSFAFHFGGFDDMAMGQNVRYLLSRDYHLFKRLFKGHGIRGFDPQPYMTCAAVPWFCFFLRPALSAFLAFVWGVVFCRLCCYGKKKEVG